MVFSSLYEFEEWHRSIQRRLNSVEDRALQRKQAALNRLHGPPRPPKASLAGRTQQTVKNRRKLRVNGRKTRVSHIVWHDHTGHWPVWPQVIHHKDLDKTNDAFENLQLMSASEHTSLHMQNNSNNRSLGNILSEETKAKIRDAAIERWKNPEYRAKISAVNMGANNPSWKGDDVSDKIKYQRIWRERRRTKAQRGTTSDMPSKSGSIPPEPTPYPPVRYEWEAD